jgi:hypothetical protein
VICLSHCGAHHPLTQLAAPYRTRISTWDIVGNAALGDGLAVSETTSRGWSMYVWLVSPACSVGPPAV